MVDWIAMILTAMVNYEMNYDISSGLNSHFEGVAKKVDQR
jgi:hypothetical protein